MLSNKSWGKKEEGGDFGVMTFVFPGNHYCVVMGINERILDFAFLACKIFTY